MFDGSKFLSQDLTMTSTFRVSPIALQLSEGETEQRPPDRIQIMRVGTFTHPKYKTFEVSKQHLQTIKKNHDAHVRGVDIALDYSHNSEGEAAAWIRKLELSEDGTQLWADVAWTDEGTRVVLGKRFRYVSADFTMDYQDNETLKTHGPTLLGAALTNRPVIKGQAPVIQLSELKENEEMELEQLKQENEALKAKIAEMEAKLAQAPAEAPELAETKAQLADAQKKLGEYEQKDVQAAQEKKLSERKAAFDMKLSDGKVVEAQRDAWMEGDMEKFAELAQPVKLSESGDGGATAVDPNAGKDVHQIIGEKAQILLSEGKVKGHREAISRVLAENPDLKKQYEEKNQN